MVTNKMMNLFKSILKPSLRFSQLRWLTIKRPPVVTIMGHVDHGKTTLLDNLRKSQIVKEEFGGITQHIGAFVVPFKNDKVTFIDTPGHAAFAAMRQRGARVTDIIVLVVACEDGLLDQTIESIEWAKKSEVPIIVAINKCDKFADDNKSLNRRIDSIRKDLIVHDVVTELDGGDVQLVKISALTGTGVDELKESIIALAETLELKTEIDCMASGHILESLVDQHRGKLCTILVDRGKITKGTLLLAGKKNWAKVKALFDEHGKTKADCGPGEPARVIGWREEDLPSAGDIVIEVQNEVEAKSVVNQYKLRRYERKKNKATDSQTKVSEGEDVNKLNVVLKCDVDGTLGTLLDIFDTYDGRQVQLEVAHFGVGAITENDYRMASSFPNSVIYGFNVKCIDPKLLLQAKQEEVPIKMFNVIYHLIDDLKVRLEERIPEAEREQDIGQAMVLQEFVVEETRKRKTHVAGCRCNRGMLKRTDAYYKLLRNNQVIASDMTVKTLKHLKEDVKKIDKEQECGISFLEHEHLQFKPNDVLVCYEKVRYKPKLVWDIRGFS